ncbi:MAG: autotransporter-associated beta strand repeat-containing protein [Bacteroidaceae bacterium]|nr:autotransporter-associated beta strand repeat-containing protein [Bacteroidaceae bacterium]
MKLKNLLLLALVLMAASSMAQRKTDKLDRGLVAVPANVNGGSGSGNFVSWKIFGEEYYDVTYNLYANGTLLKAGLKVGCFSHTSGSATTKYQVAAVVNGVEQEKCAEVTRWNAGYKDIPAASAVNRAGTDVTSQYILNDVSLGDVTGNGIPEFIVKRNFTGDIYNSSNKTNFHRYECYTLDGERLWWIDLGPNMMAGPDEQWDLVAYDWDEDGKAECIMRGADNMIIHTATGHDIQIGDMSYYAPRDEYTCNGAEYLLYLNGETGEPYGWNGTEDRFTPMAYPLPRFEKGEAANLLAATPKEYYAVWGGSKVDTQDTGHRSTKHYFGAPFLDGRHASIFLGRGCYTQHKMCALDVDPSTHELTIRWRWANKNGWSDPWYGNGFHNFAIADVDWDGRDEIVFGSMIIDDNGKGLCTTGLGHGDAQHCADFDPYRHGNEQFNCNEDEPACTYWNATTGKIYYRLQSGSDDGRALCGNFSNEYPGSVGRSTQTGLVSAVADKVISGASGLDGTNDAFYWSHLNQRIYWDGDLCDEVYDSPGSADEGRAAAIYKFPSGRLFNTDGCLTNNGKKNNAGAIADIFGDWREEVVMRTSDSKALRIFTTAIPTTYRIYTLWHDFQYRNAMVWQCVGYNQPPHKSYFLGQLEGITTPPPPLTLTGRTEIANGGTISTAANGQHVIVCEMNNTSVSIAEGAEPSVATFYVPTWVQGTNSSILNGTAKVETEVYTCTATGGGLAGKARLVKQGDGVLTLPAADFTHTGNTDIWAGTVNFDGKMLESSLWLNRFAELNSNGGQFRRIKMDYASILRPGGADTKGEITTDSLMLGFGSRLQMDVYSDGTASDVIKARLVNIETKLTGNWLTYGPQYLAPVLELVPHTQDGADLAPGDYLILEGVETVKGKLEEIIIEGLGTNVKASLVQDAGKIYLKVSSVREAGDIVWTGAESNLWQFGGDENFVLTADEAEAESFVTGDIVRFGDASGKFSVSLKGEIEADSVIVDATKNYTFSGTGAIIGNTTLVKRGTGNLTISTDNTYTGGTRISGGKVTITSLSNENIENGNLGAVNTAANKFVIENGAELSTSGGVTQGSPMQMVGEEGGVINNAGDFVVNKPISGTVLTKKGAGWMKMNVSSTLQRFVVAAGTVQCVNANKVAATLDFQGGTYAENTGSSFTVNVDKGKSGTWNTANRASYSNKITGEGTLTIYCEEEKGSTWFATRTQLGMDFRNFTGTIKATGRTDDSGARWTLNTANGMPNGTLDIADNLEVQNTGKTFAIGKVTGDKGKLGGYASFANDGKTGANTWQLGNDANWSWSGIITSNSSFIKVGAGKVTLGGKNDFTGTAKINAGELCLKSGAQLGTGSLTVAKGAKLSGVTTAAVPLVNSSVTVSNGGSLAVGTSAVAVVGLMDFGGKNLTMAKGSVLEVGINRAATETATGGTSLQNINKLTINATVKLHYSSTFAESVQVGDIVRLWTGVSSATGTPVLNDESYVISAERGLYWDVAELAQGILRVTDVVPVGIRGISVSTGDNAVYDLNGRRVSTPRRGQVYIAGGRKILVK